MRKLMLSAALAFTGLAVSTPAAQAEQSFIGQIKAFGFNFCKRGTTPANGQLLAIAQYQTLFSLYGTMYGGDGRTTFAVPNMQGRRFIGAGQGPGSPIDFVQGQQPGAATRVLTVGNMPAHNHAFNASSEPNANDSPAGGTFATFSGVNTYAAPGNNDTQMNAGSVGNTGGNQAISLVSPYVTITYCVNLIGIYPSRN